MGDYAAAPASLRNIWLEPSLWTDALDALDMLDIPTIEIIAACVDELVSGDDPMRPTETATFRGMITVSVHQRRELVRRMAAIEQDFIREIEHDCTPLALKRIARGETPLWVADTRRGVRVWVRGT